MQSSDIPSKFPIPFANAAGAGFIRPIPEASQVGIQPGAASLTDGFPPLTMTPLSAGGVPPAGADFNGILNLITAVQQWQCAGGIFKYDSAFSTSISGYPKGCILSSSDGTKLWRSTVDNNTTDPDGASPSGWARADYFGGKSIFTGPGTFTVPAGVTQIWVSACAGGGGGAGGGDNSAGQSSNVGGGGGGGGGAGQSIQRFPFTVTPGQSISISIGGGGSGGAGGAGGNAGDGGAGGNTVIGSLVTLTAGSGGGHGLRPTANSVGSGGAAGAGGAGYPYGGFGVDGNYAGNGGQGASSPFGGGGGAGRAGVGAGIAGNGASGYGSGGGGGGAGYASATQANGAAGGPGAPGIVIIEW